MDEIGHDGLAMTVGGLDGDKLKILIVSQYFWPEEFRLNELAEGLVERGHEVTVLTGLPNYPKGDIMPGYGLFGPYCETHKGIRIFRTPLIPRGQRSKLRLALNYASFTLSACLAVLWHIRGRYDVVFVCQLSPVTVGFPGILAGWKVRAPVFLWVLDLWPESLSASGMINSSFANKVAGGLARMVYVGSDVIMSTSKGFKASICRVVGREREVRWFPQWEDVGRADHQRIPALPEGFKVMFGGNVGASQDFETIVAAAALLKGRSDIQFVIIGEGHKLDWVRRQVAEQDLSQSFHCLGRFPSTMMPAFFDQADALLITLRNEPAFALTVPAKLQSYLAAGKPIVSAVSGDVKQIVAESGAGIGVDAGRPEELARAITELADCSPEERAEMGSRGRAYVEKTYNKDVLFDELVGWFREEKMARADGTKKGASG